MTLPRYPSYKDSGVEWLGEVPGHWEVAPLFGTVAERNESNKGMQEDNLLSLSYGRIVPKDISSNDGLLPDSFETYQIVYPGDIVFRLTDLQNDKRSLRSAIVEEKGIITSAYLAVIPKRASPIYVSYLFRSYDTTKVFYSMGGGLRQSMKFDDLKRMPTVLPPPEEQTQIATFLDRETAKIDVLVAEQRRLMALLKEKRQAFISHAVTRGLNPDAPLKPSGIEWLGDVPAHWEVKRIRYVADLNPSKSEVAKLDRDLLVSFLPMAAIGEDGTLTLDTANKIGELETGYTYFRNGDVTIAKITPCYENGKGARMEGLTNGIGFGTTELIVVRPKPTEVLGTFLHYLFISQKFRNSGESHMYGAGGQKRVPDDFVRNFATAFPQLSEQRAITKFIGDELGRFDTLTAEAQRAIDLLQERRTALISAAVTGQIDVRSAVASY